MQISGEVPDLAITSTCTHDCLRAMARSSRWLLPLLVDNDVPLDQPRWTQVIPVIPVGAGRDLQAEGVNIPHKRTIPSVDFKVADVCSIDGPYSMEFRTWFPCHN